MFDSTLNQHNLMHNKPWVARKQGSPLTTSPLVLPAPDPLSSEGCSGDEKWEKGKENIQSSGFTHFCGSFFPDPFLR